MATTSIMSYKHPVITSEETNYQGFAYNVETKVCVPTNHRTIGKWETLGTYFENGLVKGKSFADIGANFGFFNFKALECGSSHTIAIESSLKYSSALKKCLSKSNINNFKVIVGKYPQDVKKLKADVVMALSILHHVYKPGKLKDCVKELMTKFNHSLIVEWIDVNDQSMERKKHYLNKDYTKSNFEKLISNHGKVNEIGKGHHKSRTIYLVTK